MSGTRYAEAGGELRAERFASSPARCLGLKAGDVMRRCETLADPRDIELALFIQYVSDLPGGIEKLSADVLKQFPERSGTPAMLAIGFDRRGRFTADQVRAIRDGDLFTQNQFRLKGEAEEVSDADWLCLNPEELLDENSSRAADKKLREQDEAMRQNERDRESAKFPTSYPVSAFLEICEAHFLSFVPALLTRFCLDPGFSIEKLQAVSDSDGRPWCVTIFDDLYGALREYVDIWEKKHLAGLVVTGVGAKVLEALKYAEEQRCLALVEGFARTGKTYIARRWCEARPGKRRFVSLSEATSDKEFYREIAKSIGSASSYGFKGNEMRERVNDILRPGHLTLIIDEGHFLWPQRNLREASPRRIEWVRTALINHGVPVAMIATHQFTRIQQKLEKNMHWSSEQLIGRIAFCAKLPNHVSRADLEAVARFHLPDADDKSIQVVVDAAALSKKHLAAIDHLVMAARHEARRAGRTNVTYADLMHGYDNIVIPSDSALNEAENEAQLTSAATRHKRGSKVFATDLQGRCYQPSQTISEPLPEREKGPALAANSGFAVRRTGSARLSKKIES